MMKLIRYFVVGLMGILLLSINAQAESTPPVTIYTAKKIITMDAFQPEATAVAVKDNKIYSVGSLEEMKTWMKSGSYRINTTFANDIITPGLIEAHDHWTLLILLLAHPYVGYYDFLGYDAAKLPGLKSKQEVIASLQKADKAMKDPNEAIFAWGFDPIFFNNADLTADELDQVSKTRPIFVLNASDHIGYVNHALLKKAGYDANTQIKGVKKGTDGMPNGVLEEADAMAPVITPLVQQLMTQNAIKKGVAGAAGLAKKVGLTTVSDLLFGGPGEKLLTDEMLAASKNPQYPVRVVPIYDGLILAELEKKTLGSGVDHINQLMQLNNDKLRFGGVKFVVDGSIQGFTARLKWPGYFNGAPNGLFNTPLDELKAIALPFWKAGLPIHVHVNGDEATDVALTTLAYLQNNTPRKDNIFVLEHDQLSSPAQFRLAKRLGAYVNLFPNHVFYWGDLHYSTLLGPDRANRIDNAAEAKRAGLIYSLHTDSPVTPLGPLHSIWAAVNRTTAGGRVLGQNARISAEDALRAVTLNAAYLLGLQDEIGSIEVGKRADFTVLGSDPLTIAPEQIKNIPVIATIQNNVVFSN